MNRIKGSAMIFQINAEGEIIKTLIFIICIYLLPISAHIVAVPAFLFHTVDCAVFHLYISRKFIKGFSCKAACRPIIRSVCKRKIIVKSIAQTKCVEII